MNALSAAVVHQTSSKLSCRNSVALGASASSRAFLGACYHIMVLVSTVMSDSSVLKNEEQRKTWILRMEIWTFALILGTQSGFQ